MKFKTKEESDAAQAQGSKACAESAAGVVKNEVSGASSKAESARKVSACMYVCIYVCM